MSVIFDDRSAADQYFLTTANLIANQYGCTLEDIDIENSVIFIKGPDDKQVECCMAIVEALESFLR